MKKYISAPLCSGLVIPGLGQILNQQIRKGILLLGLVFLLFVAGALKLAFMVGSLTKSAGLDGASQGPMIAPGDMLFVAGIIAAFAIVWIYSVADAFLVAFRSERSVEDKKP